MIFKSMIPITSHHDFNIQMQINQNEDYAHILFGSQQENEQKSLTLKPGNEYEIEVSMKGTKSTSDFQKLSLDQRKCRLSHEILQNATYKNYTKAGVLKHFQRFHNNLLPFCFKWLSKIHIFFIYEDGFLYEEKNCRYI